MLNKTTNLLPNALFASLGMPRNEESILEAKHVRFTASIISSILNPHQGIDHELKKGCEDVISHCSDAICQPLREWVSRVRQHNANRAAVPRPSPQQPPLMTLEWAQEPAAESLHNNFRHACHTKLRSDVIRLRLYLEDGRTVGVLVEHVKDRLVDEYAVFRETIWDMYAGALRDLVLEDRPLREMLKEICDEQNN